jgi:hypothetical protein
VADRVSEKQISVGQPNQFSEHIRNLNAWLKDHADKKGAVFVDLFSAMEDPWHGLRRELTNEACTRTTPDTG